MIDRRVFLAGASVALARPLAGWAQSGRAYKIGFLSAAEGPNSATQAFRQELRDRGWIEGQSITIEYRWAGARIDDMSSLAKELVKLRVDVVVAGGNRAVLAAKSATTEVPVVMSHALDPVGSGLVASLGKPGGNVTGFTWDAGLEIAQKRLQLLKAVSPGLSRVVNLWDPREPGLARYWPAVTRAAESLGFVAESAEVRTPEELQRALRIFSGALAHTWTEYFVEHDQRICLSNNLSSSSSRSI